MPLLPKHSLHLKLPLQTEARFYGTSHSSMNLHLIPSWETLGQKSLAGYSPWGRKRVGHDLATKQHLKTGQSAPTST